MLQRDAVERAVQFQARGYRLLQWVEKALTDGFIAPEAAHAYASLQDAAYAWGHSHYANLPDAARPAREELLAFSRLFSTYLTNTFDLEPQPGERLYSPDAHCFCPCCSWMVRVPHPTPKKVTGGDKKVADRMRRQVIRKLAVELGTSVSDEAIDEILNDPCAKPLGCAPTRTICWTDWKAWRWVRRRLRSGDPKGIPRALSFGCKAFLPSDVLVMESRPSNAALRLWRNWTSWESPIALWRSSAG